MIPAVMSADVSMNESPSTPARVLLLVEDDPCTALLLRSMLQKDGYQVEHCADGQAALDRLAGNAFDAVILDLMMPRVDGMEVLKKMRTTPDHAYTPVVIITAARLKLVESEALRYGAKLYLDKTETNKLLEGLREIMADRQTSPSMKLRMASGPPPLDRKVSPSQVHPAAPSPTANPDPPKGLSRFFRSKSA